MSRKRGGPLLPPPPPPPDGHVSILINGERDGETLATTATGFLLARTYTHARIYSRRSPVYTRNTHTRRTRIDVYAYIYILTYIRSCVCVCERISMYVYIYIYTYRFTHTHNKRSAAGPRTAVSTPRWPLVRSSRPEPKPASRPPAQAHHLDRYHHHLQRCCYPHRANYSNLSVWTLTAPSTPRGAPSNSLARIFTYKIRSIPILLSLKTAPEHIRRKCVNIFILLLFYSHSFCKCIISLGYHFHCIHVQYI